MYLDRWLELNIIYSKQAKLLMVVHGENRHDTAIKNIWYILDCSAVSTFSIYCQNWTQKKAMRIPFASTVWSLNSVRTVSSRDKPNKYCRNNGHVKVKMPSEKEKRPKFCSGQYQFTAPFLLYADFESIFKRVDE